MTRLRLVAFALGATLACAATAQDSALPPVNTQGAVRYVSGGIGAEETDAIKAAQPTFSLSITFSARSVDRDVFLADIPVTIRNASGEIVLDVRDAGPYLLVDLAAGRYEVTATYRGLDRTAAATIVTGRNQKLTFAWQGLAPSTPVPVPAATPPPPATTLPATKPTVTLPNSPIPLPSAPATPVPVAPVASPPTTATTTTPGADPNLPAINTQGGIPFLSGGIGAAESAAIKAAAPRYSLSVTFTRAEGTRNVYLASVPVKVLDKSGLTILDLVTDGPFLLADLLPGDYRVVATYQGVEKQGPVKVAAGKPAKVTLVWSTAAPKP